MSIEESLLRVEDAAKLLRVSRWTIYRWVEEGRLEATKISRGSLRIFGHSLQALVADNRVDHAGSEESPSDRQPCLIGPDEKHRVNPVNRL